jgi:hypothetical protein
MSGGKIGISDASSKYLQESETIHKCNILYQLLALEENKGDLPAKIREAMPTAM